MKILIIEDDPMVAMIHKEYFKRKEISNDLNHVSTLEEAKEFLANSDTDLIILDNYLADGQGIEFLPKLKGYPIIMITAANDVQTVEAALTNGVVDYLVKPFTYERFSQAIDKVQDYMKLLSKEKINQDLIDDYLNSGRVEEEEDSLPKGLSRITLKKVLENIKEQETGFTTQQVADALDISRITIRKYLNHLVNINVLSEDAEYYTSGRPVSVFTVVSDSKIDKLL
ncbi:MAG: response regulator [Gemella haemolysans]|uniref:response regulator n=1 Tax=Gemella haemolysans TaxID=1379 RepID=UPI0029000AFF|nr:response regulator [Gemella haemolysans]MDU1527607.1 response regulator [Gemella haemolysans]MDU4714227.1 response regulator [Gemella haemolysans]